MTIEEKVFTIIALGLFFTILYVLNKEEKTQMREIAILESLSCENITKYYEGFNVLTKEQKYYFRNLLARNKGMYLGKLPNEEQAEEIFNSLGLDKYEVNHLKIIIKDFK